MVDLALVRQSQVSFSLKESNSKPVCFIVFRLVGVGREKKKKVSENIGQLRFVPPPWVEHASRLDQFFEGKIFLYA